jgi:hypothetical protein
MDNHYNILFNIELNILERINDEDILDKIYFLEYRVPTMADIKSCNKSKTNNDINKLINKFIDKTEIINLIKDYISNLEFKMPLYDIYTSNIYLIHKENIYKRISYNHYRFASQSVLDDIKYNLNIAEKKYTQDNNIIITRKIKKYKLMLEFMTNFNVDILKQTYFRMIYKYSEELGKNIIFCKRPSFNKYIHNSKPYYSTIEIINLALNMNIEFNQEKLKTDYENILYDLCSKISKNDISYKILLNHQKYIADNNLLGLVQYYSVQGSYYINNYLRSDAYPIHNSFLDDIITPLWNLCINSPEFDNDYILYRFVKDDSYLQHLKIGDIFQDEGFMSTTRDPFYKSDSYQFGFILMKIIIPKNKKGAGLCVETISHFPTEQEILFAPKTKFKLVKRDTDITYHHTDYNISSKIKTRYEFEFVETVKPSINKIPFKGETKIIDFINIKSTRTLTLQEKIKYFIDTYLDELNRFYSIIDDKKLLITAEKYNSIGAYENFYGIKTQYGFSFYTIYDNYLLFLIEIGQDNNSIPIMHVNFYVKYNTLNKEKIISDESFITFISCIAYYFNIETIALYPEYKPCISSLQNKNLIQKFNIDDKNILLDSKVDVDSSHLTGNYCLDFYNYLKFKTKRFSEIEVSKLDLQPLFTYYDLDYLYTLKLDNFVLKSDDEIYQIYNKSYKLQYPENNIADFFIWLIDNKCYLIESFVKVLERVYINANPFTRDIYILKPINYLYNKKLIKIYGSIDIDLEFKERKQYMINTNEYRIDKNRRQNVSYNLL